MRGLRTCGQGVQVLLVGIEALRNTGLQRERAERHI